MKKRFTEEQIIFPAEAEAGMPVAELCRKHGLVGAKHLEVGLPDALDVRNQESIPVCPV